MSLIGLFVVVCVLAFLVWVAGRVPVPFNWFVYAIVVLACIYIVFSVVGGAGALGLNAPLRR